MAQKKKLDYIPNNLPGHSDNPVHQIEKQEAIQRSDTKIDEVSYFFNKSGMFLFLKRQSSSLDYM